MAEMYNPDENEILTAWNMVFNISLNMLHSEEDAEDATQQVFEKVIRNMGSFEKRSSFTTWVYRIAWNHLLDFRKNRFADEISFDAFEQDVMFFKPYENELNLSAEEEKVYIEEVKIGCTLALLQCLDKEDRLIYILGNIFSFQGREASEICGMSENQYRKKLSRSREKIKNFMGQNCGLVNQDAPCKCRKRLLIAVDRNRISMDKLLHRDVTGTIGAYRKEMNTIDEISKIYRENPFHDKTNLHDSLMKEGFRILLDSSRNLTEEKSV